MSEAVRLAGITKRFGSFVALDEVDLSVQPGTLHAVVGENGAGKTTLMKVLFGALAPDSGEIFIDGARKTFHGSADALHAGVGMVSQHYGILPELSALENLLLGAEGGALLRRSEARSKANALATQMGFAFDWDQEAADLSPSASQKLEILKLLWRGSKIMILDEPTAMLSPEDSDALFESLGRLLVRGSTILLVTHRLPEVLNHCSEVTVLRQGKVVGHRIVRETSASELSDLIVGSTLVSTAAKRTVSEEVAFSVQGVSTEPDGSRVRLQEVGFSVRRGEVLGVAGVDGNGQRELFNVLIGLVPPRQGKVLVRGRDIQGDSTAERLRNGMRIIPEDRVSQAIVEGWSLEENSALGLQREPFLDEKGKIALAGRKSWASKVAARFDTKFASLSSPVSGLSGGNQQRFVAGRALESDPQVLLAFQPVRGLDIRGTKDFYAAVSEKCNEGMAAVVVSFDLDELLANCGRIAVMNGGRWLEPPQDQAKDRSVIGRLMAGIE